MLEKFHKEFYKDIKEKTEPMKVFDARTGKCKNYSALVLKKTGEFCKFPPTIDDAVCQYNMFGVASKIHIHYTIDEYKSAWFSIIVDMFGRIMNFKMYTGADYIELRSTVGYKFSTIEPFLKSFYEFEKVFYKTNHK